LHLVIETTDALQSGASVTMTAAGSQPVKLGGTLLMSLNTHLDALKERHASLETRILDEDHRPRPDSEALMRLKLEKLRLKDEIERLRTQAS
jgi:hypothetical protein